MNELIGTTVRGIRLPIVKSGDDVKNIICDALKHLILKNEIQIMDNDVIAITESLIARSYSNYVTIDDIAEFIKTKYGDGATVGVLWPIYSRNRFSMILRGIARGAKKVIVQLRHGKDEVGNDIKNPWTGVDIIEYYRKLVEDENAECVILQSETAMDVMAPCSGNVIVGTIHTRDDDARTLYNFISWNEDKYDYDNIIKLSDIFKIKTDKHGWCEYGLLGSNKCGDERLKLFPTRESCEEVCEYIRYWIEDKLNKHIHVMVYGDGCFKDPSAGIWEFADPISCPYHTGELLDKSPNEIKIKYLADTITDDTEKIKNWIKDKHEQINFNPMLAQGTTPRRYYDLLASLCDLTSGSGDKGTPVVLVQNYFKNFSDF